MIQTIFEILSGLVLILLGLGWGVLALMWGLLRMGCSLFLWASFFDFVGDRIWHDE